MKKRTPRKILCAATALSLCMAMTPMAAMADEEEAPAPRLAVTKTADVSECSPGEGIGYVITVEETEEGAESSGVVVRDELPDGLEAAGGPTASVFRHDSGEEEPAEASLDGKTVSASAGTLAYGDVLTVRFEAAVPEDYDGEAVVNTAEAGDEDGNLASAEASVAVLAGGDAAPEDVPEPDPGESPDPALYIEKTASAAYCGAGDEVTYTILVAQTEEGAEALNVVIDDELPTEAELTDARLEGAEGEVILEEPDDDGFVTVYASIPSLAYGEAAALVLTATSTTDGQFTNTAAAWADGVIAVSDSATVNVADDPEIAVEKAADGYEYLPGGDVMFTISVSQTKEGLVAHDVTVTDEMPEGLALADVETEGAECEVRVEGDRVEARYAELSFGEEAVIYVKANAGAEEGVLVNTAYADSPDGGSASDAAEVLIAAGTAAGGSGGDAQDPGSTDGTDGGAAPADESGSAADGSQGQASTPVTDGQTGSVAGTVTGTVKTGDANTAAMLAIGAAAALAALATGAAGRKKAGR